MKQENDEYLCKTFPKMFVDRHAPMSETAMCWGFECNDGWFNIINHLCQNIQHYLNWKNKDTEVVPQVTVDQVKEKFGTLRFYYSGGDDTIDGMVQMAESISGTTCEMCGDVGKSTSDGWIKVLCETHIEERNRRNQV